MRIIVDNLYQATTVLKDASYVHSLTPVVGVAIPDVPGGLNKVLQVLTDARVNVEYMYAFLGGHDVDRAYMIFRVADESAAEAALPPGASAPWSRRRSKPCKGTAEFLRKTRKQKETAPASAGAVRFYFLESECFHIRGGGGEKTGYPGAA